MFTYAHDMYTNLCVRMYLYIFQGTHTHVAQQSMSAHDLYMSDHVSTDVSTLIDESAHSPAAHVGIFGLI